MALEIDSIDAYDQDYGYSSPNYNQQLESRFHEAIFSPVNFDERFARKPVFDTNHLPFMKRVETVFLNSSGAERVMLTKKHSGGSVEAEVTVGWGGRDSPTCDFTLRGEAHNDRGDYVKGDITQSIDGTGSVSVGGGSSRETNDKDDNKTDNK